MYKISSHPILEVPEEDLWSFDYEGTTVQGQKGQTIAAALHQAGLPVHHHSLKQRSRSMECGIGKCGACEMLVDGHVRRICITKVDGVKHVRRIEEASLPPDQLNESGQNVFDNRSGQNFSNYGVGEVFFERFCDKNTYSAEEGKVLVRGGEDVLSLI